MKEAQDIRQVTSSDTDFKLIYHYISKFYSNFVVSNRINSKRYGTSIES